MGSKKPFDIYADFSGTMVKAWQSLLDTWWARLMEDPLRIEALASKLGIGSSPGLDSLDNLQAQLEKVVTALELVERRVTRLEQSLGEQGKNARSPASET